jgi:hypothetical protein
MKRRLEDDEIEGQLKCKMCDMGLCILRSFEEYNRKRCALSLKVII